MKYLHIKCTLFNERVVETDDEIQKNPSVRRSY